MRVTVANGANAANLARVERDRIRVLGYTQAQATNSLGARRDTTVVFVRSGFEPQGRLIASDINLTPERVLPMPSERITSSDSDADVFVVLGNDWVK